MSCDVRQFLENKSTHNGCRPATAIRPGPRLVTIYRGRHGVLALRLDLPDFALRLYGRSLYMVAQIRSWTDRGAHRSRVQI